MRINSDCDGEMRFRLFRALPVTLASEMRKRNEIEMKSKWATLKVPNGMEEITPSSYGSGPNRTGVSRIFLDSISNLYKDDSEPTYKRLCLAHSSVTYNRQSTDIDCNARRSMVAGSKLTGLVLMPGTAKAEMNGRSGTSKPDQWSWMPKVEDVNIWLRWAVDSASALCVLLLPPLLALPTHFLLLLRPHLPLPLREVGNPFTTFFLFSHPTPAPERLPTAAVRPELVPVTQLYLKGPSDLALLAYSFLVPGAGEAVGDTEAGKVAQFGEQGCRRGNRPDNYTKLGPQYTLSTNPASSTLKPRMPHFWLNRHCAHARSSVDWRLASAWNADAGSAGHQSLTCQIVLVPGLGGVPRPGPNADAYEKRASLGAILGQAESDAGYRNARALRVLGMYRRSGL
ncbi:hypothetical protein B0H13DRAFT_2288520 [Mycena leptocephala]|nr:hypothetical protein B0H13DRAFT_2288520 [Mycena leptocephala]